MATAPPVASLIFRASLESRSLWPSRSLRIVSNAQRASWDSAAGAPLPCCFSQSANVMPRLYNRGCISASKSERGLDNPSVLADLSAQVYNRPVAGKRVGDDSGTAFWQELLRLLAKRRMSLADLSRATGISQVAIQKWRNGGGASYPSRQKIAKALGEPIGSLTADDAEDDQLPTTDRKADAASVVEEYLLSEFGRDTSARTAELLRALPFAALGRTGPITPRNVHDVRVAIDALAVSSH